MSWCFINLYITLEADGVNLTSGGAVIKIFRHNKAVIQCTLYKISPLQSFIQSVAMRLVYCRFKSKKVEQVSYQFYYLLSEIPKNLYMIQHSRNLQVHFVFLMNYLYTIFCFTHRLNISLGKNNP